MKQKVKPTITYIKNGVEKTINLNFWNKKMILKKIVQISREYRPRYDEFVYDICKDIEFIHFKNCRFINLKKIKSSNETLCIFEDCTFLGKNDYYNEVSFLGGTYELIDPIFKNIRTIQRYKDSATELSIIYKKQNSESLSSEKLIINNAGRYTMRLTNIEDNCNFEEIVSDGKKVQLSNCFELEYLNLDNEEIIIGNKKTDTDIKVNWGTCRINGAKKVNLTNCTIHTTNTSGIQIFSPEVEVENVEIKTRGRIKINDNTYDPLPNESHVTVTDKDITRANLISTLKAYQNKINKQIKLQKDTILAPEYKQIKQKEKSITKSLSKKKTRYFMNEK